MFSFIQLRFCLEFPDSSPMSTRNFPPSFWNSQHYSGATAHHGATAADLYGEHYHPGDAWYQYSQHHRAVHDYHHHNMAAQYSGLLLPGSRLHMSSHAPCKAMDWQHPSIDSPYSSYPTMSGKFTLFLYILERFCTIFFDIAGFIVTLLLEYLIHLSTDPIIGFYHTFFSLFFEFEVCLP